MKARIVWSLLGLTVITLALSGYVMASAALDIAAARRALTGSPLNLESAQIDNARRHLTQAEKTFESLPARAVGWLPVVRQNFAALHGIAEESLPVVEAAETLNAEMDGLNGSSIIEDGRVDLGLLESLEIPLRAQSSALSGLAREVRIRRNGWVVPPLWSQLDRLLDQVEDLRNSAQTAADLVTLAPAMLGDSGERTYLLALMNNTELRGAGGILSGVGSVTVREGQISLGAFRHYKDLADDPPFRTVPAPKDFKENFGTYRADTTRWVTATSSPDLPDVAVVARDLFELTSGTKTNGVIFVDPRGLAAMLPPGATLRVPSTDTSLTPADVPRYVYQDAYEELGGAVPRRRESLIDLGEAAFDLVLERGFTRPAVLRSMGEAAAGGHISLVAFAPDEAKALESAGLNRDLGEPEYDGVLVTVQNIGGNKLDSYARRRVQHACRVEGDVPTRCVTDVEIANDTPLGLSRFEHQYLPYGLFKNVVEIYVPNEAELASVETDGERADFFEADEDGFSAVGVYVELPRNQRTEVSVEYELPPTDGYELEVLPQPLVEDARLTVELAVPSAWTVEGPEDLDRGDDTVVWDGPLDRALEFTAGPSHRTGLSALWENVGRFMREPVF